MTATPFPIGDDSIRERLLSGESVVRIRTDPTSQLANMRFSVYLTYTLRGIVADHE
ncbi:MAG: hypothetical protein ACT4PT_00060 [Methanobacteriota archaeon]